MEAPTIEKEKRVATVTLILSDLCLAMSPFPLILLQNYFLATTLLKAGADYPILNIPFCSSIFLSIFAVVNGLGYRLNNSYQAGTKAWYLALFEYRLWPGKPIIGLCCLAFHFSLRRLASCSARSNAGNM